MSKEQPMISKENPWVSAIRAAILSIPRGKVSTYAEVAAAAGYPRFHWRVAQVLNRFGHGLRWYRVIGAGGQIKTSRETTYRLIGLLHAALSLPVERTASRALRRSAG